MVFYICELCAFFRIPVYPEYLLNRLIMEKNLFNDGYTFTFEQVGPAWEWQAFAMAGPGYELKRAPATSEREFIMNCVSLCRSTKALTAFYECKKTLNAKI